MERPDWLLRHADPAMRERVGALPLGGFEPLISAGEDRHRAVHTDEAGRSSAVAELLDRKNWEGLGAFDGADRSSALDHLGFRSQLVFSSFSHHVLITDPRSPAAAFDEDVLYAAVRAHNRGVAEFCDADERLLGVGFVALNDPARAVDAAKEALDNGCTAIEVPSFPAGGISLNHPLLEPLYQLLEDRGCPLLFHVGGGGHLVPSPFERTGRPRPQRRHELQMAEPALTFVGMPAPIEMTLAALVLDGVLAEHPGLRCGVIEQGATWVPGFLRRLDLAFDRFAVPDQRRRLAAAPSEYVLRGVRVTPFPFEDIAWLFAQSAPELYLFGSDYPHDEGGVDPIGLYASKLTSAPRSEVELFFCGNFEHLMGPSLPEALRTGA